MTEQIQNGGQPANKKLTTLHKRTLTSVVYVAVLIGLCAMKWLVPIGNVAGGWGSLGFDAVFCAIAVIGSFEFLRAVDGSKGFNCSISLPQRAFTIAFSALVVPLYVIMEMIPEMSGTGFLAIACAFAVYVIFLAGTSVFDHDRSSVKGMIYCVFCMLYCGVLPCMLSSINHIRNNSMAAILFLFICSVFTDAGAYLIGSGFKKFIPLKLAPQLSPNKTVIGAVGGLLGGILGGIITYYLMYVFGGVNGEIFVFGTNGVYLTFTSEAIHPVVSFILVGLFTSVACQIGDLFESAVKRECGIKDMGNCLPGHGGVLDRFDSMLYCSVVVLFCFGTIII